MCHSKPLCILFAYRLLHRTHIYISIYSCVYTYKSSMCAHGFNLVKNLTGGMSLRTESDKFQNSCLQRPMCNYALYLQSLTDTSSPLSFSLSHSFSLCCSTAVIRSLRVHVNLIGFRPSKSSMRCSFLKHTEGSFTGTQLHGDVSLNDDVYTHRAHAHTQHTGSLSLSFGYLPHTLFNWSWVRTRTEEGYKSCKGGVCASKMPQGYRY